MVQWNADGINAKKVELMKFLDDYQPDLLLVQETKLKPSDALRIPEYHVLRKDRTRGRRRDGTDRGADGGGVATLIREGIPYRRLDTAFVAPNDDTTDAIAVQLCVGARLTFLNAYVPPIRGGGGADDRTQSFNPTYWPTDTRTFICTDLNGHSGSWDP